MFSAIVQKSDPMGNGSFGVHAFIPIVLVLTGGIRRAVRVLLWGPGVLVEELFSRPMLNVSEGGRSQMKYRDRKSFLYFSSLAGGL